MNMDSVVFFPTVLGACIMFKMEGVLIADHLQRPPILPFGVVECEGFSCSSLFLKRVILWNNSGDDVDIGLCQSMDSEFVHETRGRPFGHNHVAILIAKSLCDLDIFSDWMYALRAWPIKQVLLNGVSLFNYEQRSIFNGALWDFQQRPWSGVR